MRKQRPIVVAFEGVDGSGKTEHIQRLGAFLKSKKVRFSVVKYFDRRLTLVQIVNLLASKKGKGQQVSKSKVMDWLINLLAPKLSPILAAYSMKIGELFSGRNEILLFDRSPFSTYAYVYAFTDDKTASEYFSIDLIKAMHNKLTWPDVVFFFNTPAKIAFKRLEGERDKLQPHEDEETLERMNEIYELLETGELETPGKSSVWIEVKPTRSKRNVSAQVVSKLRDYLSAKERYTALYEKLRE